MHEIGVCEGLVELIEQRAAGRRVTGVRVRIGARHGIVDDAFGQAFALVAEGTGAQGAAVDVVVTPATLTCRPCGHRSQSVDPLALCTRCGAAEVDISGGEELVLESIQFGVRQEDADVPRHSG